MNKKYFVEVIGSESTFTKDDFGSMAAAVQWAENGFRVGYFVFNDGDERVMISAYGAEVRIG